MSGARPAPRVCPAHLGVLAGRAFVGGVVTALSTRVQLPFMLSLSVASSLQFLVKNLETEEATLGGRCRAAGRSAWPGRRPAERSRPPPVGTRLPRGQLSLAPWWASELCAFEKKHAESFVLSGFWVSEADFDSLSTVSAVLSRMSEVARD